jgi:hypothetical protein
MVRYPVLAMNIMLLGVFLSLLYLFARANDKHKKTGIMVDGDGRELNDSQIRKIKRSIPVLISCAAAVALSTVVFMIS